MSFPWNAIAFWWAILGFSCALFAEEPLSWVVVIIWASMLTFFIALAVMQLMVERQQNK